MEIFIAIAVLQVENMLVVIGPMEIIDTAGFSPGDHLVIFFAPGFNPYVRNTFFRRCPVGNIFPIGRYFCCKFGLSTKKSFPGKQFG
jgi:hypothetical protein